MNALVIVDRDGATALSNDLKARVVALLGDKGYRSELFELEGAGVAPCRGCLLCLTKHPGRCVNKDAVGALAWRMHIDRDQTVTVFITPILFGHFSSTIKNAVDRGVGSRLLQVFIGYARDIDDEEESTFLDIIRLHRGRADIVHPGMDSDALVFVTRTVHDNASVCEALRERL